jgi:hypothetical protein
MPRRRPQTYLALLVILATAASFTPGAAATPRDRARFEDAQRMSDAVRPAGASHVRSKPGARPATDLGTKRSPEALFAKAFPNADAWSDPANLARAERAVLDAFSGGQVTDVRTALAESTADADADGVSTDRFVFSAQDLTGDGLNDALAAEIQFRESEEDFEIFDISLAGVGGVDGAPLWTRKLGEGWDTLYNTYFMAMPDLDGDATDDVLLVTLLIESEGVGGTCALVGCVFTGNARWTWFVEALSGASGDTIWENSVGGNAALVEAGAGLLVAGGYAVALDATNVAVVPFASGDHDGNGGADVVLNTFNVREVFGEADAFAFVADAFIVEDLFLTSTRSQILAGDTGDSIGSKTSDYQPGLSVLQPAGQAVGSPTADLLWQTYTDAASPFACVYVVVTQRCAASFSEQLSLELIDGATLTSAWTSQTDDPDQTFAVAFPEAGDLDGDGAQDILVFSDSSSLHLGAISGADGSALWDHPTDAEDIGFATLGPVGGDDGDDVLVLEARWEDDSAFALDFLRVDGADGAELSRSTLALADAFDLWVFVDGDFDGDGTQDVVTEVFEYSDWRFAYTIESGRTAETLYRDEALRAHYPAGDLDADGSEDLLTFASTSHRFSFDLTTTALSMPSGAQAWSVTHRFLRDLYADVVAAGDIDGVDGDDLFFSRLQFDGHEGQSRYEGMSGRDGSIAWTTGDTFSPPPPLGTSSIAGTVRNGAGDPLADICLEPYDAAARPLGWNYSALDGTYVVNELEAGVYRLRATDCWGDTYRGAWVGGTTFADATAFTLATDQDLTGIDIALTAVPVATNDAIASATLISSVPFADEIRTESATIERGEPQPCDTGATVWYSFTPSADGTLTVDTAGSSFDTVLALYADEPLEDTLVVCNDDDADSTQAALTADVSAGTTYLIQAGGFYDDNGRLNIAVDLT